MGNPYSKDSIRLYNISPLFHAKNIKNPIMVLQGQMTPEFFIVDEMVKPLEVLYVEYAFEDAGHVLLNNSKYKMGKILLFR